MLAGWTRALVLVAVAALLASIQCYGNCMTAACRITHSPAGSCHHHKSPQDGQSDCLHQHSEFTNPEIGVAKVNVNKTAPMVPVIAPGPAAILIERVALTLAHSGSPPRSHTLPASSVLRI
jgi:hypothetical protein